MFRFLIVPRLCFLFLLYDYPSFYFRHLGVTGRYPGFRGVCISFLFLNRACVVSCQAGVIILRNGDGGDKRYINRQSN